LGEGLAEAEIVEWKVSAGDTVQVDQVLLSVETAKALVDVPSPVAGVMSVMRNVSVPLTSSPTLALRVTGGGFPLLGDSCSRSTGFLLHRAA
ncbi:MAG: biotin/lipoyl-containing protein, partial [Kluyvera sp.]